MTEPSAKDSNLWPLAQRIAFRFITVFFLLYIFPFPFGNIPGIQVLIQWYSKAWQAIAVWVGDRILHLSEPITLFEGGSGDKIYDYVSLLVVTVLALIAAALWSFFDRRQLSYPVMLHWLRVLVRYYLGMVLVMYGMIKVFHLQMASPTLFALVQPFGDKTPMGLAWSYVGFSKIFSAFVGASEVIGGMLLFFRRTTTLGALIGAAVMLNVVVMNFTFDIPVKLYSSILFVMAVFLMLPDADRLMRVLLWNKPTEPRPQRQYLYRRWMQITALVIKILFIGSVIIGNVASCFERMKMYGDKRERSPVYGIYDVTEFIHKGDTLAPLTTDGGRWKQLITDFPNHVHVRFMNDSVAYYPALWDTTVHSLVLNFGNAKDKSEFQYEKLSDSLRLRGVIGYDTVEIRLQQRDLESFHLLNKRFRWVQEYPHNR